MTSINAASATEQRIGFVGLGNQGGPMAHRLIDAGFNLMVWARRPEMLTPFTDAGARAAETLAALASASDIVCICVTNDRGVIEVFNEILPSLRAEAIILIHATVHPQTCRALAAQAKSDGVELLDAPVSGGADAARAGTLTVMGGGDPKAFAACRPLLASFAGVILWLGEAGAGQLAKLVNNALMAANLALAHEALSLGAALGIERAALSQVIAASSGGSFAHSFYASMPNLASFSHAAALLRKDMGLLEGIAKANALTVNRLRDPAIDFFAAVAAADASQNSRTGSQRI